MSATVTDLSDTRHTSPHGVAASTRSSEELAKDLGIESEIRAKYKIEVTFDKDRTIRGPNRLGIQVWESGRKFHGGGDQLMFFCKNVEGDEGCWAPITQEQIKGGIAFCTRCSRAVNAELLTNIQIGNVSTSELARTVTHLFRALGSNADIYLKFHRTDIRYIAMERAKGPDVAARLKGMHIYPLKNILKDTSNGADLTKRFFAFLTS